MIKVHIYLYETLEPNECYYSKVFQFYKGKYGTHTTYCITEWSLKQYYVIKHMILAAECTHIHTEWDKDVNCPTSFHVILVANQFTINSMKKLSVFTLSISELTVKEL